MFEKMCLGKKKYNSNILAAAAAGRSSVTFNKQFRYYKCPFCDMFHLTSHGLSESRQRQEENLKKLFLQPISC